MFCQFWQVAPDEGRALSVLYSRIIMINIGYWLETILVRLKLFCCLLSLELSMLFVWDIVVRIFGGNLFEVVFIYLRLGRLFLFWSWESLVQNFLTLFINWSDLFSSVHYFLNQRHYFKNLYSYQGHSKKFPVTKKKKEKEIREKRTLT